MKSAHLLIIFVVSIMSTSTALAHHSFAIYDIDRLIERTGILRQFTFKNPHIQLELEVKQDTVGEVFQTARGGSVPSIDTRELQTSVLVNNGETVVLGGIFQDERNRTHDRVPYLSSIPGIGNLFKRRANENKKRELLIFVTPTIVEERPSVN